MFKTEIYLHMHNKQGLCYSASGDYSIQMSHGSASGVCCLYWFSFMISCLPVCLVIFSNEHRSWKKKNFSNNLKLRMTFVFLQKTSICFCQELRGTDNLGSIWSNFRGWSLETPRQLEAWLESMQELVYVCSLSLLGCSLLVSHPQPGCSLGLLPLGITGLQFWSPLHCEVIESTAQPLSHLFWVGKYSPQSKGDPKQDYVSGFLSSPRFWQRNFLLSCQFLDVIWKTFKYSVKLF